MINNLQALGYGIIGFAVIVGIGIAVLQSLSTSIASCPTLYTYNTTNSLCQLDTNISVTANPSTATQNVNTMSGYLGTSSGGLTTWIPVIVVLVIGMMFLGAFMSKKGKSY